MQRKIFWLVVVALEIAAFWLPFWWQVFAILPIVWIAWWVAYRSDWFYYKGGSPGGRVFHRRCTHSH